LVIITLILYQIIILTQKFELLNDVLRYYLYHSLTQNCLKKYLFFLNKSSLFIINNKFLLEKNGLGMIFIYCINSFMVNVKLINQSLYRVKFIVSINLINYQNLIFINLELVLFH
jgi:hypothetical protein